MISRLTGFVRTSTTRSICTCLSQLRSTLAVMKMHGNVRQVRRTSKSVSKPVNSGICISSSRQCTGWAASMFSASRPVDARSKSYPCGSRTSRTVSRQASSSSAIRIENRSDNDKRKLPTRRRSFFERPQCKTHSTISWRLRKFAKRLWLNSLRDNCMRFGLDLWLPNAITLPE